MQMTNHSIHQPDLDVVVSKAETQNSFKRSPAKSTNKQTLISSGDLVYLYGDRTYTGTLIHPVEHTSPPLWTVKLDRGGYEAVNMQHIRAIEPKELEIPFSDKPETSTQSRPILSKELQRKISILEKAIEELETEKEIYQQQCQELKRENENLKQDLEQAKQVNHKFGIRNSEFGVIIFSTK